MSRRRNALPQLSEGFFLTDAGIETDLIFAVDDATATAAAYFMVNCAHPDHFFPVLEDSVWARRIRGVRCNASRLSHAELDECETLDDGDPIELSGRCVELRRRIRISRFGRFGWQQRLGTAASRRHECGGWICDIPARVLLTRRKRSPVRNHQRYWDLRL